MHREIIRRYKLYGTQKEFHISFWLSFFAFVASLIINYYAIQFATEHASNAVSDIILSNTPVFDVDKLFVYGTFIVSGITTILLLSDPKRLPFALKGITLFFLIRSVFTSLTHIAPFTPQVATEFGHAISTSFFGGDLFFSGHTGLPFLGALAFWHVPLVRYFYLIATASFAAIVLLGHYHYSIDVLSAFFITYSIYHIAQWLFPKDFALFNAAPVK